MTNFDARTFVNDFVTALNKKDPEGIVRYYGENVELSDPTTPQPLRGKDGVRKYVQQWSSAMSEIKIDVKDTIASGNKVAILVDVSGRHTGELELGPGETIPATNKTVRLELANFLTLDGQGKVVKDHSLFDVASMMTQLGLLPEQGTGTTERTRVASKSTPGR